MKTPLAFVIVLNATLVFGQPTKLSLASDVWPPFTDVPPNHAFALDLVQEALARDSVKEQTHFCVFKEVVDGISDNKYDGSAAMWYTEERDKFLLFSEPYLENRLILVGKKGSNVSARSLSDLAGKRVATVESYGYGPIEDARKVIFTKGSSDQENMGRLLTGEVDYLLIDALLIEYLLKFQGEEAARYLEIGTNTMMRLPLHFAIRRDVPNAEKIIKNFNDEITQMIADGSYNRILQLNWLAYDIDGDGEQELVISGEFAGDHAPQHSYGIRSYSNMNSVQVSRYVVNGNLYPSWEAVPDKYKQSQPPVSDSDKQGFGTIFKF